MNSEKPSPPPYWEDPDAPYFEHLYALVKDSRPEATRAEALDLIRRADPADELRIGDPLDDRAGNDDFVADPRRDLDPNRDEADQP